MMMTLLTNKKISYFNLTDLVMLSSR
uniref:Uncharacterized protein n=1 Tax=Lepeophtheirus salmonis TaxID=72036 RepID=A0A0K2TFF6_LEPSM